jgi:hypothetical protein
MRILLCLSLFLFSFHLDAKKAPKWKPGTMQVTEEGMRYSVKKTGPGETIVNGDLVHCLFYFYNSQTKKYDRTFYPFPSTKPKTGPTIVVTDGMNYGLSSAIKMLKAGGEGFFIFPNAKTNNSVADSTCYYVRVIDVIKPLRFMVPDVTDTVAIDSVKIEVNDPGKKNYGDTLFSVMKLTEVPQQTACGISAVIVAFKFELTWFDNGTQHKSILVFVECPEQYGKDYFVKGASYVVTAIPMTENYKSGHRTMNSYSLEKLESYYSLRVKKMSR